MALEVRIPKEITEYQEKLLFGLSIRQLISFSVALVFGLPVYYFTQKLFGADLAGYIVIFGVVPIFAFGFFKKNGFYFEKYVSLVLKHKLRPNKRIYKTELNLDKFIEGSVDFKNVKITQQKRWFKKGKRNKDEAGNVYFKKTKANNKAKSKAIKRKIKTARKEFERAKRDNNQRIKEKESC